MSDADRVEEPITVTDKRRIDPETGHVRETPAAGPAPSGPAPEEFAGEFRRHVERRLNEVARIIERAEAQAAAPRRTPPGAAPGEGRGAAGPMSGRRRRVQGILARRAG